MIYEHAPIMIDSFDEEGHCILWNNECEELLGFTKDEMSASTDPLILTYPEKEIRDKVLADIMKCDGKFKEYKVNSKSGISKFRLGELQIA